MQKYAELSRELSQHSTGHHALGMGCIPCTQQYVHPLHIAAHGSMQRGLIHPFWETR